MCRELRGIASKWIAKKLWLKTLNETQRFIENSEHEGDLFLAFQPYFFLKKFQLMLCFLSTEFYKPKIKALKKTLKVNWKHDHAWKKSFDWGSNFILLSVAMRWWWRRTRSASFWNWPMHSVVTFSNGFQQAHCAAAETMLKWLQQNSVCNVVYGY